ncbi:MAG: hypothetical protein RR048_00875 [Oscillospiraceae bacterium]
MKKLLSAILGATIAAGTAVTTFADAEVRAIDTDNLSFDTTIYVDETEVKLGADVKDVTLSSESVVFVPFVVKEEGQDATKVTKLSDLDDVRLYVKVTEGSKYVEKYEIAKENNVYGAKITLEDYFGSEPVEVAAELSLKNRKTGREIATTVDYENMPVFEIKNSEQEVVSKNGVAKLDITEDTQIVSFDDETTHISLSGDGFYFDVKASNQDALYLGVSNKAIKGVATAFENADLTFIDFVGTPVFDFSGTLSIIAPDNEKEYFMYEVAPSGKLAKSSAKFNKEDEVFELKTNKLSKYILSDKELDIEKYNSTIKDDDTTEEVKPETPNTNKPSVDTGAIC